MKNQGISLCVALALTYAPCFADAANPNKSSQPKASTPTYATAPLDPSTENLPRLYAGHSCNVIARKISSFKPTKSEYETTADYKQRLSGMANAPLVGTTALGDLIGFVTTEDVYSGITQNYNADLGILMIKKYSTNTSQLIAGQLLMSGLIEQKIKGSRNYLGSNAYGKKVSVSATHWSVCGIAFSNFTYQDILTSRSLEIDIAIELSPNDARLAKDNLAVMYVGQLSEPYLGQYTDYSKPTIDLPSEISMSGDAIVIKLAQLWLFNRQTGKVYQKIDF